jgi:hypothetical protein
MQEEGGDATDMTAVAAESCRPSINPINGMTEDFTPLFQKTIYI